MSGTDGECLAGAFALIILGDDHVVARRYVARQLEDRSEATSGRLGAAEVDDAVGGSEIGRESHRRAVGPSRAGHGNIAAR